LKTIICQIRPKQMAKVNRKICMMPGLGLNVSLTNCRKLKPK